MVKWSGTWFEKLDQNGIRFGKWVEKKSSTHALCRLCNHELKFDQQGIQPLKQHPGKPQDVEVSKLAFSSTVRHFEHLYYLHQQLCLPKRKPLLPPFCWKKYQLQKQCGYSKRQKRICLCEIVIMSLQYLNVCFQTVKLQKHSPWGKAKLPMFFKMGWDHCWQGGCAKVF